MYNLAELYYPITARPDSAGELMPCKALQPYIRCYWGSMGECGAAPGERSVMPDKLSGQQPARGSSFPTPAWISYWNGTRIPELPAAFFAESMIRPLKWRELNLLRPVCALPSAFIFGRCICSRMSRLMPYLIITAGWSGISAFSAESSKSSWRLPGRWLNVLLWLSGFCCADWNGHAPATAG